MLCLQVKSGTAQCARVRVNDVFEKGERLVADEERGEVATSREVHRRSKLERLPNLDPYLRRGAS
jgi:hypothetical protein